MKKTLLFIAMAMVMVVGCQNKNNPSKPGGGKEDNNQNSSEELIAIDGDFADWDAAGDRVVTIKNVKSYEGEEISEDLQRIDALKVAKFASDKYNLYVYCEVDKSIVYKGGVPNWAGEILDPSTAGPVDIYIDADCKTITQGETVIYTGGINWIWEETGWEYGFEASSAFSSEGEIESGELFKFTGADGTDIWAVDPPAKEDITGEGIFSAFSKKEGDIVKFEIAITRAFMPKLGDKIKIGVEVMSENWMLMGVLPQANGTAEGAWQGLLQEITLYK